MNILGINAFHGDASVALVKDGNLEFALEEERINRIKHSAGFPIKSIEYCLNYNNLKLNDINSICFNFNSRANLFPKIKYSLRNLTENNRLIEKLKNQLGKVSSIKKIQNEYFPNYKNKFKYFDHHECHLASSYFISPFEKSTLVSVDGFGDFSSSYVGIGDKNKIKILEKTYYPHSPGLFYLAVTQFLNFNNYGDEYKVMGLSAFGKPKYKQMLKEVMYSKEGKVFLNLKYFNHIKKSFNYTWEKGTPKNSKVFSEKFDELFKNELNLHNQDINEFYADFAASAQSVYEDVLFKLLNDSYKKTQNSNLCLSGGCAMNSLANGKIIENTYFTNIFIPPSPGDSGGAVGAAFLGCPNKNYIIKNTNPFLGPKFTYSQIVEEIDILKKKEFNFLIKEFNNKFEQAKYLVQNFLTKNNIIAIFQEGCEWGPRALGNRSIIANPQDKKIRDIINKKIKLREPFRPFAPTIIKDKILEWFDEEKDYKYMSEVVSIKKNKAKFVPAVVHVDGTCRLQTLEKDEKNLFYLILENFFKNTGIPIVLNTSFNINEPIVFSPKDAIKTFINSDIDCLSLENFLIIRN